VVPSLRQYALNKQREMKDRRHSNRHRMHRKQWFAPVDRRPASLSEADGIFSLSTIEHSVTLAVEPATESATAHITDGTSSDILDHIEVRDRIPRRDTGHDLKGNK